MTHYLKTRSEPFIATLMGDRNFEFRKNDRDFRVGDTLVLQEWELGRYPNGYTGREVRHQVTYVARGPDWGIPDGYVVMSFGLSPGGP